MRSPRAVFASLIALLYSLFLAVALTGCGGGGGGKSSSGLGYAAININWSGRSRDTVTAPSAALSAVITLKGANFDGSDMTWGENRDSSNPAAYSATYRSPKQVRTGTWPLTVTFYANAGGSGSVVGIASATLSVPGNGNTTTISLTGTIQSLAIAANQVIPLNQDTDITYTATDAKGNVITITPGSAFYTVVSGTDVIEVDSNGQLKGLKTGTAQVTVKVNNTPSQSITSPPQTVTVGANIAITPPAPVVAAGATQQFTATVTGYTNTNVTWKLQEGSAGGTITGSTNTITYTAPSIPGTYHLIATTVATPQVSATATITVTAAIIYIADTGNGSDPVHGRIVSMTDMKGTSFSTLSTQGSSNTQLGLPTSVAIGPDGRIYIADPGDNKIVRSDDMRGDNWTTYTGSLSSPRSVFVASNGQIYIADQNNNRIVRMDDITGTNLVTAGIAGNGVGEFNHPSGIWVTSDGHIFVADQGNNRIVEMTDMQGGGWITYGGTGNGTGQFNGPASVMVGLDGKIYIADQNNSRIVRINDMTGAGWTSLGSGGSGIKQFNAPADVFYGPDQHIYVADEDNNRIVRMDDMTGKNWTTYQGSSTNTYSQLELPTGIFVQ